MAAMDLPNFWYNIEPTLQRAREMYSKLDEEYYNLKQQVLHELGPSDTWANENGRLEVDFIRFMAKNHYIYMKNEKVKIGFFLWDALEEKVNKIGGNLDEIFPIKDKNYLTNPYYKLRVHTRHTPKNQRILNENLDRYITAKEEILKCWRQMDLSYTEWVEELGPGGVFFDSKHTFFNILSYEIVCYKILRSIKFPKSLYISITYVLTNLILSHYGMEITKTMP